MRGEGGSLHEVVRLASRQHGVVTRAQLRAAGLTDDAIDGRVGTALHRVHRAVYRVGHRAPSTEAAYMAAVLAAAGPAGLSGRAAAHCQGLVRGRPPRPEVTTTRNRRVPGVVVHRVRQLSAGELTAHRGIPITTVPRTLVDLAAVLDEEELMRAAHEADVRHRVTWPLVEPVLARRPTVKGAATLRAILRGDSPITLSRLERLFLAALRRAGLPLPAETNRRAGSKRVDCRWPAYRLTVELDSYRFHRSRRAWEEDLRREREARARGDEHRRYTWRDVVEQPAPMLAELRRLLA